MRGVIIPKMWLNSHLLVSRCRKSSVIEIWEGWEQAEVGREGHPLSCWHTQTPACPSPSLSPVVPQDMQILLLVLCLPSSPSSFLPSISATPSAFVCFSSARLSSALIPSFLALLGQSCHHFSNAAHLTRVLLLLLPSSLAFHSPKVQEKSPRRHLGRETGNMLAAESVKTLLCPTAHGPVRGEHFGGTSHAGLGRSKNNIIPFPACWKWLS